MKRSAAIGVLVLLGGCELQEIVTADSERVVIAELYLRTDIQTQVALLHETRLPARHSYLIRASVEVTNDAGVVMHYIVAPDSMCASARLREGHAYHGGVCFMSDPTERFDIAPGRRYQLRITLPDGDGQITGATAVPADFSLLRPTNAVCALPPATRFEVAWTASPDAWVYPTEISIRGLRRVLEEQGIEIEHEPVRLFGLSISSTDTTISFPNEFGLFDRFDNDLTEALVAIQNGLPATVVTDVVVAAADRNYVNWERGGNFNPSGVVRIGNLRGAGAGVFGSMVVKHFQVRVGSTEHPPC